MVGCCIFRANGGHLRPTPCPSLSFFCPICCPKTTGKNPPHALRLERISSLSPPPRRSSRPSVGCHVILSIGGHLRLMRRPPLYYLMGVPFGAQIKGKEKWRERAAPPSACAGLMGICDAMRRIHGGCCHGERGQSRWGCWAAAGVGSSWCCV